jgi:glycosyltransferase involved in cell wall biosynthesis
MEASGKRGIDTHVYHAAQDSGRHFSKQLDRWFSLRHYRRIERILQEFKPDLLHAHGVSLSLSPSPFSVAKRLGIPILMTIHDFNYLCPRKWMIDRDGKACRYGFGPRCLISNCRSSRDGRRYLPYHMIRWLKIGLHRFLIRRSVDLFICPSRKLYSETREKWTVESVYYLANFISPDFDETPEITSPNLLFVGRLSREKGVDCLLKAFADVIKIVPETILTIVGDGPEKYRLERLSNDLKINEFVQFAGEVEHQQVHEYYKKSAICILPSLWMENCPIAGLEALSHGRPLVGSEIGGIPDLVEHGRNGYLFQTNQHRELAGYLVDLLDKPELIVEFGRSSRSLFEKSFTESIHMDRLLKLYQESIRRMPLPRSEE